MASVESLDADWLLEQWVRWCRCGTSAGGRPPLGALLGSRLPAPIISDEQALAIDRVVARLCAEKPVVGGVMMTYYARDRNYSETAREHELDRKRVVAMVAEGVGWVGAKLDDFRCLDRVKTVFSCLRRGEPVEIDSAMLELIEFFKKAS